ncbi:hypothetical protein GF354_00910 [Candidatus Peregrinibacteria bacterium]|nr:hypothetical protein [Candidatus Peregrinibacteria bacterium]
MKNFGKLNKKLLLINVFFLQAYLLRFVIPWPIEYPSNLMEILIGFQLIFFVLWKTKTSSFIKMVQRISAHWIILSLIALSGLSLIINEIIDPLSVLRHIKFLVFASILAFIFLESFDKNSDRSKAINIAGYGAIIFGIFSIFFNLFGYNVAHDLRLNGPLDSAVYLAYYLTPFFIWFAIRFLENTRYKKNLILAIILFILIIATRSMGAIGGSIGVLTIYLFLTHRKKILKSWAVKIGLSLILITTSVVIFYSKILPSLQTDYSSLDERGEIWETSFNLLSQPRNLIFGLGYGQFQEHYFQNVKSVIGHSPLDYYVLQPHNIFLIFLSHYGILGLIFIFYCILLNLKNLLFSKNLNPLPFRINFIILYFFTHGLIDTPIFKNDLLFLFILFLEIGLNYCKPDTKSIKEL